MERIGVPPHIVGFVLIPAVFGLVWLVLPAWSLPIRYLLDAAAAENRHHVFGKFGQLVLKDLPWHAHDGPQIDALQAGVLLLDLPQVIDKLTPSGTIPDNHNDMVEQALALLTKSKSA